MHQTGPRLAGCNPEIIPGWPQNKPKMALSNEPPCSLDIVLGNISYLDPINDLTGSGTCVYPNQALQAQHVMLDVIQKKTSCREETLSAPPAASPLRGPAPRNPTTSPKRSQNEPQNRASFGQDFEPILDPKRLPKLFQKSSKNC